MSDLISRQAAIGTVKHMREVCDTDDINDYYVLMLEAFNVLPPTQPDLQQTCNELATDTISRRAAIDTAAEYEIQLREILGDENELVEVVKILKHRLIALPSIQPETTARKFEGIVVEYPHPDLCTYPEYKGKPYFSIKYTENGECFVGFGTYKPEVLSDYLKTYFFISSAQPEPCDAISRADAIRVASGYCHPANVAKELAKLPSVQPELKRIPFKTRPLTEEEKEDHPEWDCVLDCKFPDDGQAILVSINVRGHERVQYDEFYTDDGSYLDSGYEIGTEATAWMPLPEPYREDTE